MKNMKIKDTKILVGILIWLTVLTVTVTARPTVIMTFDDGWLSVSEKAYPIMQSNNQTGVAFVYIAPIIGAGYPDFMKQPQLNILYGSGWDISSHTYSHADLTTVNDTILNFELGASKDWLDINGYPRGAMFLAYPSGSNNPTVIAAVKTNHYVAARTVNFTNRYLQYTLSSPDVYMLEAFETLGGRDNDSIVINQINNTITANGTLILAFHKIVDTLSTNASDAETEFKTSDFQNVSNYLRDRTIDGSIDVRTLSDYFGAIPLTRYMPPTPANISATIGNNWTRTAWNPGIGDNATNLYNVNVNGVMFNGIIDTFINITIAPGGSTNVTVYAVNTTNGNTTNPVGISLNTTLPLPRTYMPPTPANLTISYNYAGIGNSSILIQWEPGLGGGNMTDVYNIDVNNTMVINGTVNTSYSITSVIPGVVYPVKIYAVNITNGTTTNTTPAMVNAIIPLYLPGIPVEIKQTYGNFWAYFEWKNGTDGKNGTDSNKTDLYTYNVDGNWTNLTTNTSVNVTTVPRGKVNVSVYAYNSSHGGIINSIPLVMSLQIPTNQIEIGNIWAEYDIFAGDTLRISPIVYNPDNDNITFMTSAATKTNNATINRTTGAFILNTSKTDQGIYHWNISAKGDYGTSHTIDFLVVIITPPAPPVSNGGGNVGNNGGNNGNSGGGADIYDPNAELYERRDSQIRNGAESKVTFFNNKLVSNVTFQGLRNYGEVTVKVSILKGNPTPNYLSNAYKFFSISLDNIQQKFEYLYISNSTLTVAVNKSNLNDNTIKVYRYVNGSWIDVKIEETQTEDANTKQFKLDSNGFSNFAVVLEPKEPIQIPSIQKKEENTTIQTGNALVDNTIEQISKAPESLYRMIINIIKKYMWWI